MTFTFRMLSATKFIVQNFEKNTGGASFVCKHFEMDFGRHAPWLDRNMRRPEQTHFCQRNFPFYDEVQYYGLPSNALCHRCDTMLMCVNSRHVLIDCVAWKSNDWSPQRIVVLRVRLVISHAKSSATVQHNTQIHLNHYLNRCLWWQSYPLRKIMIMIMRKQQQLKKKINVKWEDGVQMAVQVGHLIYYRLSFAIKFLVTTVQSVLGVFSINT